MHFAAYNTCKKQITWLIPMWYGEMHMLNTKQISKFNVCIGNIVRPFTKNRGGIENTKL